MAKDANYFIKVQNPKQTRRMILENTRDILKVLQGYEDYKRLRERRSSLIHTFKSNIDEVRTMVMELKRLFPKTAIKEVKKAVIAQPVAKPVKEIKKIEQELADIEEKLGSI